MELKGKRVVVMGLADSGVAAIRLLAARGASVVATDQKSEQQLKPALDQLAGLEVEFVLGRHPESIFEGAHAMVISPGVPRDAAPVKAAQARGVLVLSELEFAARLIDAPILAVTGTNGKTTTVTLAGEIMKAHLGDGEVFVGGNIGMPLTELPLSGRAARAVVVEVSSFQLEFAPDFHPKAAVMINVTDDHLDRYRDFADYAATKESVFQNQSSDDWAVINVDDAFAAAMVPRLRARLFSVSLSQRPVGAGMWVEGDAVHYALPQGQGEFIKISSVLMAGRHNLVNVMCAAGAAWAMGAPLETSRQVVEGFKGLHHRMEFVRELGGVRYYNDSKATNSGAVEAAVLGLDSQVALLMGGQAKGCHFQALGRSLRGRVRLVLAFGECKDQLAAELGGDVEVKVVEDVARALTAARDAARPGDAVILAPACASFDQFKNYQDRGDTFKRLVMEMV